jgi:hypothetical protein
MTKQVNTTETVSVRVKADANTDFVRFGGVDIGKSEYVQVGANVKNSPLFSLLDLQITK